MFNLSNSKIYSTAPTLNINLNFLIEAYSVKVSILE